MQYHDNYDEWTDSAEIEAQQRQSDEENAKELAALPLEPTVPVRIACNNGPVAKGWEKAGALVLAALLAFPALSKASSACLEARPASDSAQYVHVTDKAGKVHRLALFILGEEDGPEFAAFLKSRKHAAMDPGRMVYVKAEGDSLVKFPDVLDCPSKKRKGLKL
jgi:hypothetical protein